MPVRSESDAMGKQAEDLKDRSMPVKDTRVRKLIDGLRVSSLWSVVYLEEHDSPMSKFVRMFVFDVEYTL